MKKLPALLLIILLSTSLACLAAERVVFGPPTATPIPVEPTRPPTSTPVPTEIPPTEAPQSACLNGDCITACLADMQSIINAPTGNTLRHKGNLSESDSTTLVTYTITGDTITPVDLPKVPQRLKSLQENTVSQQNVWNYFAIIIPAEQRRFLNQYIVYTDGKDEELAAVTQSDEDPARWNLMVDIADAANPQDLTFTLIHEFGHLLTLNPAQIPPNLAVFNNPDDPDIFNEESATCNSYFTYEGCANPDAYLTQFVYKYWDKIFDEWADIEAEPDEDLYYERLDEFYNKYEDQFITDYAPTSPEEDIAESFSYFILEPRPAGATIAERKVLFFYDFPELVQLREQIARGLCSQTK